MIALAAATIGAIFSSTAPDMGTHVWGLSVVLCFHRVLLVRYSGYIGPLPPDSAQDHIFRERGGLGGQVVRRRTESSGGSAGSGSAWLAARCTPPECGEWQGALGRSIGQGSKEVRYSLS